MPAVAAEATQPAVLVEPLGPLRRPDRTGLEARLQDNSGKRRLSHASPSLAWTRGSIGRKSRPMA
jgi:hypothetical protein